MIILPKKYFDGIDLQTIGEAIFQRFDGYSYCKLLLYQPDSLSQTVDLTEIFTKGKKVDPVLKKTMQLIDLENYVEGFGKKVEALKETFTKDEKLLFQLSVIERKTTNELCDALQRSYKGLLPIKKSCYMKIALVFGLMKPNGELV